MAAVNNPYYIQPPDVLKALQEYDQSYKTANDAFQQAQRDALLREVGQQIQTTGKVDSNALGRLLSGGMGTLPAVNSIGTILNNEQSRALQQQQINQTGAYQKGELQNAAERNKIARDTLEQGKTTRQYVPDIFGGPGQIIEMGPTGNRITQMSSGTPAPPNQNITSGTITGVEYGPEVTDKGIRPAPQLAQAGTPPAPAAMKSNGQTLMEKYGGNPNDGKNWDFLATLPEKAQTAIVGLTKHDLNPASYPARTAQGMSESVRSALTTAAAKFDPTYNQQDYPNIQASRLAFDKGTQGNTIRSLNVIVDHAATLRKLGEALDNGNYPLFNSIAQTWADQTGKPAPTNFDTAKRIVGTELVKSLGAVQGGTEHERRLSDALSKASSTQQIIGAIDDVIRPLVGGQLRGLRQQFISSTKRPESEFNAKLFPETLQFLDSKAGTGGKQFQPPSNWQYSPSRKQYRDPSGKLYDIDGNPVK